MRVNVAFDSADYAAFTGGTIGFSLSEKQCALILSLLPLMLDRSLWQPMTDAEWDDLEEYISALIGVLQ